MLFQIKSTKSTCIYIPKGIYYTRDLYLVFIHLRVNHL